MRTLIIDDSKTMRMILGNIFRDLNIDVIEASNGEEALRQLKKFKSVDLALVDWKMPVMNGMDFIERVRKIPEHQRMRIIMVTSEGKMANIAQAMKAGVDEYIIKPFTPDAMIKKLMLMGLLPQELL